MARAGLPAAALEIGAGAATSLEMAAPGRIGDGPRAQALHKPGSLASQGFARYNTGLTTKRAGTNRPFFLAN
jgi:hypothetical protein